MTTQLSPKKEEQLQWRRAHPLSPLTRVWAIVLLVIWNIATSVGNEWTETSGNFFEKVGSILANIFIHNPLYLGGVGGLALLVVGLFFWGWFFTRFAVDAEAVYQRSGVLSKKFRKANLERIQSIDIVRPLLPRLLGLAEVSVDVADGSDTALKIQYLKHSEANAFRAALLRKTQEQKAQPVQRTESLGADRQEPLAENIEPSASSSLFSAETAENNENASNERELTFLPTPRLIGSIILNPKIWGYLIFSLLAVGVLTWATGSFWGALAGNFAIVIMTLTAMWSEFNQGFRFRVFHGSEGLKIRKGFTNTTTQSVPTGRIQALEIRQPFLWKKLGWYTVTMNVAGYGLEIKDEGVHRSNLMLVSTEEEINRVLPLIVAQRWDDEDAAFLSQAMNSSGDEHDFTPAPNASKWFDPLSFRRNGFGVTPHFLLIRRGAMIRRLTIVPHNCIQSIELTDGPLQRRLDLATLKIHSVTGQITPVAKNVTRNDAKQLLSNY